MTIKVGVYGATGYTGLELIRLLGQHNQTDLIFATSESSARISLRQSHPQSPDIILVRADDAPLDQVDCVFLCLPHTRSAPFAVKAITAGVRVVDLSADFRLDDPAIYEKWYKVVHPAPEQLPIPYGLPELGRDKLIGAECIANPGCYATTTILGLAPLVRNNLLIKDSQIIVDAKSGVSGAGRSAKTYTLFSELQQNFYPYSIGRNHRHIAEIEQVLGWDGLESGRLIFSPHLLPTDRGILATTYVRVNDMSAVRGAFEEMYQDEVLVEVLSDGEMATLAHVVRTPRAVISLHQATEDTLIVVSVTDNLLKGAASQAIQNFNLMYSLNETMGLLIGDGAAQ